MQLRFEQLAPHLARDLRPVYLVSGDEPLQSIEAVDLIRSAARARGFTDRTVLEAEEESALDWDRLAETGASLSLFADRRLIELRIPSGRTGQAGGKALAAFAAAPPEDTLLLVSTGKLPSNASRARWYQAIDRAGACVAVWPIARTGLPRWLQARARSRSLALSAEAADELADRCEGNLAFGAQAIERLALLVSGKRIELDDVLNGAAYGARFSSFDLVDATLAGDAPRALRILAGLAEEGEAPPAVVGALAWQIRTLARIGRDMERGAAIEEALRAFPAWRRRRTLVAGALRRRPVAEWTAGLATLAHLDAVSKGAEIGEIWDGLGHFVLDLCGVRTASRRAV